MIFTLYFLAGLIYAVVMMHNIENPPRRWQRESYKETYAEFLKAREYFRSTMPLSGMILLFTSLCFWPFYLAKEIVDAFKA